MIKHLPNFLTCCNLLSGCLGILFFFNAPFAADVYMLPAYFVWASCLFDFLDGFAARMLKASSPIGKELDSLADVISFGLLPTFLMFELLASSQNIWNVQWSLFPYLAFLIIVCSALRLAIFNVDETQSQSFRGLPTPANALFITGIPFLFGLLGSQPSLTYLFSPWALAAVIILFSLLMVSRVELFALKFKSFRWTDNPLQFIFLGSSALLLVFFHAAAIPLSIILYILLSLGVKAFSR